MAAIANLDKEVEKECDDELERLELQECRSRLEELRSAFIDERRTGERKQEEHEKEAQGLRHQLQQMEQQLQQMQQQLQERLPPCASEQSQEGGDEQAGCSPVFAESGRPEDGTARRRDAPSAAASSRSVSSWGREATAARAHALSLPQEEYGTQQQEKRGGARSGRAPGLVAPERSGLWHRPRERPIQPLPDSPLFSKTFRANSAPWRAYREPLLPVVRAPRP